MPTMPNTHQTAQAVMPSARVAHVDNDAVVLACLRALAAEGSSSMTAVEGDVREADTILNAVAAGIDLTAPAGLLMWVLAAFLPGRRRMRPGSEVRRALAPGSYVALLAGRADGEAA